MSADPYPTAPTTTAPPSPQAAPKAPAVDPNDLDAVWSAFLDAAQARPALSWVRFLTLQRIEGEQVRLGVMPGHREVMGFATPARRDQLAQMLGPILGRRMRVDIQPPTSSLDESQAAAASPQGEPTSAADRQAALNLPLVKQVAELFDVTLLDVSEDEQADAEPDAEKS